VAWAGEEHSANWLHIAREYTEKWHHQQQIRNAVNKPGTITKELYYPCIATFLRGLPYAYRNEIWPDGSLLKILISGDAGGIWYLQKTAVNWELKDKVPAINPDASVVLDGGCGLSYLNTT
jgi:hypothetical protein